MRNITRNQWIAIIILTLVIANAILITSMILRTKRIHDDFKSRKEWRTKQDYKEFIKTELNLTPEQFEFFKTERENHFKQMDCMQSEMDSLRKLIRIEAFKPDPNKDLIIHLSDSIAARQAQLEQRIAKHFFTLSSGLTPEQRVGLENLIMKKGDRHVRYQERHRHRIGERKSDEKKQ